MTRSWKLLGERHSAAFLCFVFYTKANTFLIKMECIDAVRTKGFCSVQETISHDLSYVNTEGAASEHCNPHARRTGLGRSSGLCFHLEFTLYTSK